MNTRDIGQPCLQEKYHTSYRNQEINYFLKQRIKGLLQHHTEIIFFVSKKPQPDTVFNAKAILNLIHIP